MGKKDVCVVNVKKNVRITCVTDISFILKLIVFLEKVECKWAGIGFKWKTTKKINVQKLIANKFIKLNGKLNYTFVFRAETRGFKSKVNLRKKVWVK